MILLLFLLLRKLSYQKLVLKSHPKKASFNSVLPASLILTANLVSLFLKLSKKLEIMPDFKKFGSSNSFVTASPTKQILHANLDCTKHQFAKNIIQDIIR